MIIDKSFPYLYNDLMPVKKTSSVKSPAKEKNDKQYVSIPLPSLGKINYGTTLLLVVIILLSFIAGSLYTKVQFLEQGGGIAKVPTTAQEAFVQYAKQLKMDDKKFAACVADGKYAQRVNKDAQEAQSHGVMATPGFFINGVYVGGAFPYESFKEVVDKELAGGAPTDITQYTEQNLIGAYNGDPKMFDPVKKTIVLGDAPIRGDSNAKITIVEYSDFQCPYCQAATPTINQILNEYKGKVKLAYKHLPLSIHKNAQKAAEASECAKEQGKFWEYHDLLFNTQQQWGALSSFTPPAV
jgi:protein-disulfide isomerase